MGIKKLFKTLLTTFMVGSIVFSVPSVWADDEAGASMFATPMMQKILLSPGEQYQGVITVSNGSAATRDLDYTASVGSYGWNRGENDKDVYSGAVDVETKSQYNLIMDWITLSKSSGSVSPNSQDKVYFTIDVPEDAPAGAQYATILIANSTNNNRDGGSGENNTAVINESWQLASAIIANVTGKTVERGSIVDNSMPSFLLNNKLEATSMVKNEGNVYTDAEYVLQVWPLFSNEEICTNEEKPEASLVLPETERYHSQSCDLPSVGIFRAKQIVRIFGEESIVEKTIIVCPIWLLFIIIFVVFALIFYFVTKAKARKKAAKSKSN